MADWRVVENVGRTLVSLIERRITQLTIPNVTVGISTPAAFTALGATADPFISLFLFQITDNAERRNKAQTLNSDGSYRRQPLPLELCYLVTAWGVRDVDDIASDGAAALDEARLLGAVMQGLYDNAEVGRSDLFEQPGIPVWGANDSLQIVMETLPTDAHYRFWDAGEHGFRLSLVYRVRVVGLDPMDPPPDAIVTDAELAFA